MNNKIEVKMKTPKFSLLYVTFYVISSLILSGCSSSLPFVSSKSSETSDLEQSNNITSTIELIPTKTITPTALPSPTPTYTPSPQPTSTSTHTPTPTSEPQPSTCMDDQVIYRKTMAFLIAHGYLPDNFPADTQTDFLKTQEFDEPEFQLALNNALMDWINSDEKLAAEVQKQKTFPIGYGLNGWPLLYIDNNFSKIFLIDYYLIKIQDGSEFTCAITLYGGLNDDKELTAYLLPVVLDVVTSEGLWSGMYTYIPPNKYNFNNRSEMLSFLKEYRNKSMELSVALAVPKFHPLRGSIYFFSWKELIVQYIQEYFYYNWTYEELKNNQIEFMPRDYIKWLKENYPDALGIHTWYLGPVRDTD
jgi:hypothetical protein